MPSDRNRNKTRIAVYLIGIHGDTILLGKRKNVTHMNGYWSLPAGHVQEFESCLQAMTRETAEECGIQINQNDLQLKGAMHHLSPLFDYINYIFLADLGKYQIINNEPEKCESLEFFPIDNLPSPIESYIQYIIHMTLQNDQLWIAEYGWNNENDIPLLKSVVQSSKRYYKNIF